MQSAGQENGTRVMVPSPSGSTRLSSTSEMYLALSSSPMYLEAGGGLQGGGAGAGGLRGQEGEVYTRRGGEVHKGRGGRGRMGRGRGAGRGDEWREGERGTGRGRGEGEGLQLSIRDSRKHSCGDRISVICVLVERDPSRTISKEELIHPIYDLLDGRALQPNA